MFYCLISKYIILDAKLNRKCEISNLYVGNVLIMHFFIVCCIRNKHCIHVCVFWKKKPIDILYPSLYFCSKSLYFCSKNINYTLLWFKQFLIVNIHSIYSKLNISKRIGKLKLTHGNRIISTKECTFARKCIRYKLHTNPLHRSSYINKTV